MRTTTHRSRGTTHLSIADVAPSSPLPLGALAALPVSQRWVRALFILAATTAGLALLLGAAAAS